MNRHERRRQKKNNKLRPTVNSDLVAGIREHTKKNFKEAEDLYNKVLSFEPNNYEAIRHLGILKQDLKEYENAYNYFIKAIQINPNGFQALSNLATIHMQNKNYELASKCLKKSFEINSTYIPTINNLAGYYHKMNDSKRAIEFSLKALKIQPGSALARNQYAKALIINNQPEEAIDLLEKLNEEFPTNDDFKVNLSSAYREMGEFEKANKISTEGFKKDFKNVSYLLGYTKDKKNKLKDSHIKYYDDLIESKKVSYDDKAVICHSFFEYFKNQKNFDKAGSYLVMGNNAQYEFKEFDIDLEKKFFEKLKFLFSSKREFATKKKIKKQIPIFVCGMPRSGTTLCEQILSSHSKITGAGELNYLAEAAKINRVLQPSNERIEKLESILNSNLSLKAAREEYLEKLASKDKSNSTYISDKMPHNFIFIGLIKLILPEAKIIYCKRDPLDNCFSLYSHKFIELSHQYSYNQKILTKYYKLHEDLMKFWFEHYSHDIFVLDNEKLVNNQEKVSRELIDFCELDWESECLEFHKTKRQVRTASIEQVRQPMNKKSIGAWKKYEIHLQELISNLND
tara:strand:+ start:1165 stop:2874 length:1710 start_codon:yes stop_codon:yes gene_type:complete